jgi:hypothetical protein
MFSAGEDCYVHEMRFWLALLLLAAFVLAVWGLAVAWTRRELRRGEERRLLDQD